MMFTVLAILGGIAVLFYLARSRELFVLGVRDGRTLLVRGRIPRNLHVNLAAVVEAPPVRSGTIKVVKTEMGAQLSTSGDIDEGREQRMRNVLGLYPAAQLRSAPAQTQRTLGQILGVVWLAWLL